MAWSQHIKPTGLTRGVARRQSAGCPRAQRAERRFTIPLMSRTWILQANPRLYEVDAALQHRPTIYWRIPQYTDQVQAGDRTLIWRAGQQAGFVGYGVVRADPQEFDLASDHDPYVKHLSANPIERYSPIRVWPGEHVPKASVAEVIPQHRIVVAPMGTVFPLDTDELALLRPLLESHGYDLERVAEADFTPLPILPSSGPGPTPPSAIATTGAKITPALMLLSSTPERPIEITIEGDALRLLLLEREALKALDDSWDAVGVYLLIGKPWGDGATLSVYVGKAQAVRTRIRTGHTTKEWTRCLLVQREGVQAWQAFNASDISWLERRLIDVLLEAPAIDLINKIPPPPEAVPDWKAEILERTVVAMLGVLGVLGAYIT